MIPTVLRVIMRHIYYILIPTGDIMFLHTHTFKNYFMIALGIVFSIILFSCDGTTPEKSIGTSVFSITARVGDAQISTLEAVFKEEIGKIDRSKFSIQNTSNASASLEIAKAFFWKNVVYITIKGSVAEGEIIDLTLEPNAVYNISNQAIIDGNNEKATVAAQIQAGTEVGIVPVADSNKLYILYDTQIKSVDTDKIAISKADVKITVQSAKVVESNRESAEIENALAHYGAILAEAGVLPEDFLGYVVEVITGAEFSEGESVSLELVAGAVADIKGETTEENTLSSIVAADTTKPTLENATITSNATAQSIILTFSESVRVGKDNITIQQRDEILIIKEQRINTSNSKEVIITLYSVMTPTLPVTITLNAGFITDIVGNSNDEVSKIVTLDKEVKVPESIVPTILKASAYDVEPKKVIVEFTKAITILDTSKFRVQVDNQDVKLASSGGVVVGAKNDANKITLTLDAGGKDLVAGNKIGVAIDAEAVEDSDNTKNIAITTEIVVTDGTAPILSNVVARTKANTTVVLTFNENIKDETFTTNHYGNFVVKIENQLVNVSGVSVGPLDKKLVSLTLVTAFKKGNAVEVSLLKGAVQDAAGNAIEATTAAINTTVLDNVGPVIVGVEAKESEATTVLVEFDEALDANYTLVANRFSVNGAAAIKAEYDANSTTKVVLTVGTAISKGVDVKVTLVADAVQDTISPTANKSIALATATTESSTTLIDDVGPVIVGVEAKESETTTVLVEFNEVLDANYGLTASNFIINGTAATGAEYDANSTTKVVLTVGTAINKGADVKVTLVADAVQDTVTTANKSIVLATATTQSTTKLLDNVGPTINNIVANVAANKVVEVVFNEPIQSPDEDKFIVKINNGTTTTEATITKAAVKGTDESVVIITLQDAFAVGNTIAVTMTAAAVQDKAMTPNASKALSTATTESSTTVLAGPVITKVSANDGATTTVVVEFNETITIVDATKFSVSVAGAAGVSILTNNATAADKKVTLTLVVAFKLGDTIAVTMQKGAVKNGKDVQNAALTTTGATDPNVTTVTDGIAPTLSSVAARTSANTTVVLTFNENIKDETFTTNHYGNFVVNIENRRVNVSGVSVGLLDKKLVSLTLVTGFTKGNTVEVSLLEGAVQDTAENAIAATTTAISTTVLDNVGPVIVGVEAKESEATTVLVEFDEVLDANYALVANRFSINGTAATRASYTGTTNNKQVTLTVGTAISKGADVKVTLVADAVQDTVSPTANKSIALATATTESSTTLTDNVGPVIVGVEAKESEATKVLVEFDEALDANYGLTASNFIINGTAATGASYTGTTNNKQVTLTVGTAINKGADVKVTLVADAVQDTVTTANKSIALATATTQSTTKLLDDVGPIINNTVANVAENKVVEVVFDEPIQSPDKDKFIVKINNGATGVTIASAAVKGTDDSVVIITLQNAFTVGNTIAVTMTAAAVQDKATTPNASKALNTATTESSTTVVAGSVITKVSANDGATTTVVVEFNEAITIVDATKFSVSVAGATAVSILTNNATAVDKKVTLTLVAAFKLGDTIAVTMQKGAVKNGKDVQNAALTTTGATDPNVTTVTDGIAPTLSSVAARTSANTTVVLTFNENIKDETFTTNHYGNFVVNIENRRVNVSGVVVGPVDKKLVSLTLVTGFTKGNTVEVSLLEGAVQDTAENAIAATAAAISTTVLDNVGPVIVGVEAKESEATTVLVEFDEALDANYTLVATRFSINGTAATRAEYDANSNAKVVLTVGTAINKGADVKVTLVADAVQDTVSPTANKSIALATATTESSTTLTDNVGPVIVGVEAKESEATTVLVEFDEALDANYGLTASNFIINGTAATGASYTGTTNNKQVTLTVGTAINKGADVKVTLVADAVQDTVSPTANKSIVLATATTESSTTLTDNVGPVIKGVEAKESEATTVLVEFDEVLDGGYALVATRFSVNGAAATRAEYDANSNAKVVLTVGTAINKGGDVKVTLVADAVQDTVSPTANKSIALATATSESSITLTDDVGPVIVGVEAKESEATKVLVEFDEALDANYALVANRFSVNGTAATGASYTGTTDNKKVTLTVGTTINKGADVKVTLVADAVQDTTTPTANKSVALATATTESSTTLKDNVGPVIVGVEAKESEATTVLVEFDENIAAVDSSKFIVVVGGRTTTITNAIVGLLANAKKVTLTVGTTISKGATVAVTLLADAVEDTATPANKSIALTTATSESSTTLTDNVGPVIEGIEAKESEATKVLVEFDETLDANYVLVATRFSINGTAATKAEYDANSNAKVVLTVGTAINKGADVKVTLVADAVQDTVSPTANKSIALTTATTESSTTLTDDVGPVIVGVEAKESEATTVLVEFDEALDANYGLTASNFIINGTAATGASYTGTTDNKKVTLTVGTAINKGATVAITLLADAVQDTVSPTANKSIALATATTESSTTLTDNVGPVIKGVEAKESEATTVLVEFDEVLDGGYALVATRFSVNGAAATRAEYDANSNAKVVLTVGTAINKGADVKVTLVADAVQDTVSPTANKSIALAVATTESSTTLTDDVGPVIVGVEAKESEATKVLVEFDEALDANYALVANRFSVNGTAVTGASYTGTTDNKKVTLTVGTAINKGATVAITLLADAVQDTVTPANESIVLATATSESTTTLTDDVGPVIKGVEAKESEATKVIVEFDENIAAVDSSKFIVVVGGKTTTITNATVGLLANAKKVTLTVGTTISKGATVAVTLLADAVEDTATTANKSLVLATATTESSTTIIDDVGPVIVGVSGKESEATKIIVEFDVDLNKQYNLVANRFSVNGAVATKAEYDTSSTTKVVLTVGTAISKGTTVAVTLLADAVEDKVTPKANKSIALATATAASKTNLLDDVGPVIKSVTVKASEPKKIEVEFNEPLYTVLAVDKNKFRVNGKIPNSVTFDTNNTSKVILTVDSAITISAGVTLLAEAVQDTVTPHRNKSVALTVANTDSTTNLLDDKKPEITSIIADSVANKTVEVIFSEAVTIVDATKFKVAIASGAATAIGTNNAKVGTGANTNKVTLTLATAFAADNIIKVTMEAGAVQDGANNNNDALPTDIGAVTIVKNGANPYITNISASTSADTEVIVEFSKAVTIVDATKFKVAIASGVATAIGTNNAKVGTGANTNKVTLTLGVSFKFGNTIEVTMEAGAVRDGANNNNLALTSVNIESTTKVVDGIGPKIVSVEATDKNKLLVVFDEVIKVGSIITNKFKVNTPTGNASATAATLQNNNEVVLEANLVGGKKVTVTLEAGAVQDELSNMNVADTTGKTTAYRILLTKADIDAIENNPTDNYKLLQDINLNETYTTAVVAANFTGIFDGNNNTINGVGFDVSLANNTKIGMFQSIGGNAQVSDVTISVGTVLKTTSTASTGYFGILAGEVTGSIEINNVAIKNPNDTKYEQAGDFIVYSGGFIGNSTGNVILTKSSIYNLYMDTAPAGTLYIGGVAGRNNRTLEMKESYAIAGLKKKASVGAVGGVIGHNTGTGNLILNNSYIIANVSEGNVTAANNIGLIAGQRDIPTSGGSISISGVWIDSINTDTQLSDNENISSAVNAYSNIRRGEGSGSVAEYIVQGKSIPNGFDSSLWEVKKDGARPTLKNNSETDRIKPTLLSVSATQGSDIILLFDEPLSSTYTLTTSKFIAKIGTGTVSIVKSVALNQNNTREVFITPNNALVKGNTINVTLVADAVEDNSSNKNTALTVAKSTIVKGSAVLRRIKSVSANTLVLEFSGALSDLDKDKFIVKVGTQAADTVTAANIQNGNEVKLDVNVSGGGTVKVTLHAGAITDSFNNTSIVDTVGKTTDYIVIKTQVQLQDIGKDLTAKYKLLNDIQLANPTGKTGHDKAIIRDIIAPIDQNGFTGVLDGNGFSISNLNFKGDILDAQATYLGLFQLFEANATVENLTIEIGNTLEVNTTGRYAKVGILVGRVLGSGISITNVHIRNPNGTAFKQSGITQEIVFGGMIAEAPNASITIKNSSVDGIKTDKPIGIPHYGGFVGISRSSLIIEESYVANTILKGKGLASDILGGIVGHQVSQAMVIKDSYIDVELQQISNNVIQGKLGLLVGGNQYGNDALGRVEASRVWVQSVESDTKLMVNGNANSTTNVYSNVTRGTGAGSAVAFINTGSDASPPIGTNLPTGFSSDIWERKEGRAPTLKNNLLVPETTGPVLREIDVKNATTVVLTFDEALQSGTAVASRFKVNATTGTIAATGASVTHNQVSITVPSLVGGEKVKVTLDAEAVQDTLNNKSIADTVGKTTDYRIIITEANLVAIKNNLGDKYVLLHDIALTGTKTASVITGTLTGTFDGNGKKITNLNFNVSSGIADKSFGLFEHLGGTGTIKNLTGSPRKHL